MVEGAALGGMVGQLLAGRYRVQRLIARGGMADVYEAADERLQRQVAVKVFRAELLADRTRFDREVRLLSFLDHPGLVRVFDAGEHDRAAFLVLELVHGPSLASRLADGPMPPGEVAHLGSALADALAYIHAHGVVHRDVTPSNVLRDRDGCPRLVDFGIARVVGATRVTATATALGTAAYMAPEQVHGRDVTGAADVYALGLVLLELLTGERAFQGTLQEVALARLTRAPDVQAAPAPWRGLLGAMTERDPAHRPSAAEVRRQLTGIAAAGATIVDTTGAVPSRATRTEVLTAPLALGSATPTVGARRRVLAGLVGLVGLVVWAAIAAGGDDPGVSPTSTVPVTSAPETTAAPPTTVAPATTLTPATTEAPPPDDEGEGRGKGKKGEGKGDD